MIARTAGMTRKASPGLYLDRGTGVLGVPNDQALRLWIAGVLATRTMTRLADRNTRIGAISDMQSQRVQRMGEVTGFELMARDAGPLTDGLGIGHEGIVGDMRPGKPRCRWRYMSDRREAIA